MVIGGARWLGWVLSPVLAVVAIVVAVGGGLFVRMFARLTDSAAQAAWVQAAGSIVAILAGVGTLWWQNRQANQLRERDLALKESDRDDRAKVLAFRLSGWLTEVGMLIELKLESCTEFRMRKPVPLAPQDTAEDLKFNLSAVVEGTMADLHHLRTGAGDIAQLDFHVRYFDVFLDKAATRSTDRRVTLQDVLEIYENIEAQLRHMQKLHSAATRHLAPIIDAGVVEQR